jgi:hypothetical protein
MSMPFWTILPPTSAQPSPLQIVDALASCGPMDTRTNPSPATPMGNPNLRMFEVLRNFLLLAPEYSGGGLNTHRQSHEGSRYSAFAVLLDQRAQLRAAFSGTGQAGWYPPPLRRRPECPKRPQMRCLRRSIWGLSARMQGKPAPPFEKETSEARHSPRGKPIWIR